MYVNIYRFGVKIIYCEKDTSMRPFVTLCGVGALSQPYVPSCVRTRSPIALAFLRASDVLLRSAAMLVTVWKQRTVDAIRTGERALGLSFSSRRLARTSTRTTVCTARNTVRADERRDYHGPPARRPVSRLTPISLHADAPSRCFLFLRLELGLGPSPL